MTGGNSGHKGIGQGLAVVTVHVAVNKPVSPKVLSTLAVSSVIKHHGGQRGSRHLARLKIGIEGSLFCIEIGDTVTIGEVGLPCGGPAYGNESSLVAVLKVIVGESTVGGTAVVRSKGDITSLRKLGHTGGIGSADIVIFSVVAHNDGVFSLKLKVSATVELGNNRRIAAAGVGHIYRPFKGGVLGIKHGIENKLKSALVGKSDIHSLALLLFIDGLLSAHLCKIGSGEAVIEIVADFNAGGEIGKVGKISVVCFSCSSLLLGG